MTAPTPTSAKSISASLVLQPFAICFLAYAVLSFLTLFFSRHLIHLSMIWNLFLAFLPLIFACMFWRVKKRALKAAAFVLWLLFLPNAFYVLTDFIHISDLSYFVGGYYDFKNVDYVKDAVAYLELINIAAGYLLALGMGLLALKMMHGAVFMGRKAALLALVFVLVGYAIYIGRFLRLNSWDVLLPAKLAERVGASLNGFSLVMTLLFAAYAAAVYFGWRFLFKAR